ncbi:MAG: putative Ig domain-containing protein [Synergistaceae bacterium]|nr:putative Ig domain-containing protein [Synergistaceae bacterium]
MRRKFASIVGVVMLLLTCICPGAWAGPRDDVVNYAWQIWNYTWTTSSTVPRYNYDSRNGPATVTGTIKGVPYTYVNMISFSEYKALSVADKGTVASSNSMKYGMVCATLVTDCIRQGFPSRNLPLLNMVMFHKSRYSSSYTGLVSSVSDAVFNYDHTKAQWQNIWANIRSTQKNSGYPAYKKLQKGDYLNDWNHVILVVENDTSAQRITYIDQTSCWDSVANGMVGTHKGTYYYSDLSNKCYVPMYVNYGNSEPNPTPDTSGINPGLRMLTTTIYAKSFTLTSGRYDVYTDSSLTTKLSSTAWTGENDEDYITGVGKNSSGTVYARISYPVGSTRKTAYVSLKKVFVQGTINEEGKKAKNRHYGLYKRRNSGKNSNYGVDAGDTVYRLTDDGSWVQILYPTSGSVWRIAWLTKADYNTMMSLGTAPKITTTSLPDAYVGENYNAKLSATGTTPITWSCKGAMATVIYGFMLDGKNFTYTSTNGVINGKIKNPSSTATPFTVTITVTAKNSYGSDTKKLSVTVRDRKPVISTSSLPQATQGRYYSATLKASGATPITWSASGLPRGLSINKSTGKISGTPAVYGTFNNVTVTAKNSKGSGTRTFKLIVNRPPSIKWTLKDATAGVYYSDYVTVNYGTSPFKAAVIRGSLPAEISMSVSGSNVYFKGTPKTAGSYSFTLRITDKNGATATKALSITVKKKALTFTYSFASGTKGKYYSDWVKVSGGTTPITVSVSSGKLPRGTSLSVSGERIYVKGVPTATGTYSFTLAVKSKDGATGSKQYSISVIKSLTTRSASSTSMMGTSLSVHDIGTSGQASSTLTIPLSVSSSDVVESYEGRDSDIVKVRAGKSVTFMLGYWDDTVKAFSVYVDGRIAEGISISDEGTFSLPPALVRGDFRVCVKSQSESETLRSEELYIISE